MQITILGECPSKKNSRAFGTANGRIMSFPGKNFRSWNKDAQLQLMAYRSRFPKANDVWNITITFFPGTKRKGDLSNKAESVMDALVEAGLLPDDNWFFVPRLLLKFGEVDPSNPRVEIEIS